MTISLTSLLLTFLFFSQILSQQLCPRGLYYNVAKNYCEAVCPIWTYIGTYQDQPSCLAQSRIKAVVRPTVEEKVFILSFSNTPVPFQNEIDFAQRVHVEISSPTQQASANVTGTFLTEDKSVMRVVVDIPEITLDAQLAMYFPNFQIDNTSQTYIGGPALFTSLPYTQLSQNDQDTISSLTKLDRGLEYAWIVLSCLNPYAFLYMNTKLYRETLEMFKKINVQYGPLTSKFLVENNNKFSGFKAPNMFPILIMDTAVSSGWNRGKVNSLPLLPPTVKRAEDLEIPVIDPVYSYDSYALFLDNYGIQLTVFLAVIFLIIVFETLNLIFRKTGVILKSKAGNLFKNIRIFLRWNLLIGCIMGSYQSLIFYIMVQIQAFSSEIDRDDSNNKLNFWFAIAMFIVLGVGFPLWLLYKLTMIYKERKEGSKSFEEQKEYYGIFFMFNNLNRPKTLIFVFALQIRAIIFAALTVLVSGNPTAQIATIVAISVIFTIFLVALRPFSRVIYTIYQLLNELVLIFYLSTLLYLNYQKNHNFVDFEEGEITGFIIIALWLFVPTIGIIYGFVGIAMRFAGYSTQTTLKPPMPVENQNPNIVSPRQEIEIIRKKSHVSEVSHGEGNISVNSKNDTYVRSANTLAINKAFDHLAKEQSKGNIQERSAQKKNVEIKDAEMFGQSRSVLTIHCPAFDNFERNPYLTTRSPDREDLNYSRMYNSQMRSPAYFNENSVYENNENETRGRMRSANRRPSVHKDFLEDMKISPQTQRRFRTTSLNLEKISNFRKRAQSVSKDDNGAQNRTGSVGRAMQSPQRDVVSPSNVDVHKNRRAFLTGYQIKAKYLEDEGFKKFQERFAFDEE